jgi:hypothetical protein
MDVALQCIVGLLLCSFGLLALHGPTERRRTGVIYVAMSLANTAALASALATGATQPVLAGALVVNTVLIALLAAETIYDAFWRWRYRLSA